MRASGDKEPPGKDESPIIDRKAPSFAQAIKNLFREVKKAFTALFCVRSPSAGSTEHGFSAASSTLRASSSRARGLRRAPLPGEF
jgi:hypothetical protein